MWIQPSNCFSLTDKFVFYILRGGPFSEKNKPNKKQPKLSVAKQAPSYARRLQSETMTHPPTHSQW